MNWQTIKNAQGEWIMGFNKKILSYNSTHTELQAFKLGLQMEIERQLVPIEIETVAAEIIHLLEKKSLLLII